MTRDDFVQGLDDPALQQYWSDLLVRTNNSELRSILDLCADDDSGIAECRRQCALDVTPIQSFDPGYVFNHYQSGNNPGLGGCITGNCIDTYKKRVEACGRQVLEEKFRRNREEAKKCLLKLLVGDFGCLIDLGYEGTQIDSIRDQIEICEIAAEIDIYGCTLNCLREHGCFSVKPPKK